MGLALAFELNCGSVSGDGTGSGGSGGTGGGQSGGSGQAGKGGGSGGNAGTHGGSGGQAGAGATSGTGGQGGDVVGTGGNGGHASGAGGDHASGGGGGHASGGAGGHASGGAAGGGAGSGGHAGASGDGGAGGAAATGGHGQGGQGGGETCAELANDYAAALPAAEACTPGAANQCQQLVSSTLSICVGCQRYVNDPATLNAIRNKWTSQGCDLSTALIVCPAVAILCINPGNPGNCVATDGAAPGGVCGIGVPTPVL